MNRPFTFHISLLALAFLHLAPVMGVARGRPSKQSGLQRLSAFEWTFLDINSINCTIASDGPYADCRRTNNSGLEWPKGSGKTAIFTAGLWIAGRHVPTNSLRTANMDYWPEYQPGPLLETFNTSTLDDSGPVARAADPRYRLYKITLGDTTSRDYLEWPGDLGAPFVDVNQNGAWDQGIDRPKLRGNQQIWGVINDANVVLHSHIGATPPMGIELQVLYYALYPPGPLGNTMFMEWTIINKSDADYDNVFVGLFSDPDLGDANNDLPGSDSTLDLGYVYNGRDFDGTSHGYGYFPPAAGFVLLAGPSVLGSPGDSARIRDGWIPGYRNLHSSSYIVYTGNTYAELSDPPHGTPKYSRVAYDYHLGKAGTAGKYIKRPDGSLYPLFWFSGDPVAGTGDLPANFPLGNFSPQDVKMMLNVGPFAIAAGDTQFVACAYVISQGTDRLNSVEVLKEGVRGIQSYFASPPDTLPSPYGRDLSLSSDHLAFGHVEVGTTSDPIELELRNVGARVLEVNRFGPPLNPEYRLFGVPDTPFSLEPGSSLNVGITFSPTSRGNVVERLEIASDATWGPNHPILLSGRGVAGFVPAEPGVLYLWGNDRLATLDVQTGDATTVGYISSQVVGRRLTIRPTTKMLQAMDRREYFWWPQLPTPLLDISPTTADIRVSLELLHQDLTDIITYDANDVLYGVYGSQLYRADVTTGEVSLVGDSSEDAARCGDIAFSPVTGTLWGFTVRDFSYTRDTLLCIDTSNGRMTRVTGIEDAWPLEGIAFDADGSLYGALRAPYQFPPKTRLVRIDTVTGTVTDIVETGVRINDIVMRTDTSVVVGVVETSSTVPMTFELCQNYPNPFNPSTTIDFTLPHAGFVTLKVYTVLGEEVTTLIAGDHAAGTFKATWDASGMPSGVYFYRLTVGEFVELKKMVLVR